MKRNNGTTFILLSGIIILIIFTFVSILNLMPNNKQSNSYYAKVEDNINAKIESVYIDNNKLFIVTSGNAKEYCVKTTISVPKEDSFCFKSITNNKVSTYIQKNNKYYIWIKDNEGNISNYDSINY